MPSNGSRYHAEVKVIIEGHDCRLNIFADTLHEIFGDIGTICAHFPREWAPAPSVNGLPQPPPPKQPTGPGAQPMDAVGQPLPASHTVVDDQGFPSEVPVCQHCGNWDGMELIEFKSKKDGKQKRAWKCQACDKWHFPEAKKK